MTNIDWIIVVFVALMAFWGYAQGLIVSALSLTGFAIGAIVGSRLTPLLLTEGSHSPYAPLFTLFGALGIGAIGALILEQVGAAIRQQISLRSLAWLDGIGGALLLTLLGLGLVWIAGAVALQTPGARKLRKDIQRSKILAELNGDLPPTGSILNALARFDPFPQINGPQASVAAPDARILRDPDVKAGGTGVVRVLGTACGLAIEGSGWVAAPDVVVTNAHVVAGESDTVVENFDGERFDAQPIAFDPDNDVAVLHASGLGAQSMRQAHSAKVGERVAILGYPENGPYTATPGRLGPTSTVRTQDAYGSGPVLRRITSLRGRVRSGNSGGPAVDDRGRVTATLFAATTKGRPGGFGVPPAIVERVLRRAHPGVDTGPCAR